MGGDKVCGSMQQLHENNFGKKKKCSTCSTGESQPLSSLFGGAVASAKHSVADVLHKNKRGVAQDGGGGVEDRTGETFRLVDISAEPPFRSDWPIIRTVSYCRIPGYVVSNQPNHVPMIHKRRYNSSMASSTRYQC